MRFRNLYHGASKQLRTTKKFFHLSTFNTPLSCQSLHNFGLKKSVLYPLGYLGCSCHSTARFSNDNKEDFSMYFSVERAILFGFLRYLVTFIIVWNLSVAMLWISSFLFDYTVDWNCNWKCLFLKHFAYPLCYLLVKLCRVCVYPLYYHFILSSGDTRVDTQKTIF